MVKSSQQPTKKNKSLLPTATKRYYDPILERMLIEANKEGMVMKDNKPVDSPQNLQDFESILYELLQASFNRNFGFQHYLKDIKYIKTNPTIEDLIQVECDLNKQKINTILGGMSRHYLDGYKFLKLALERNYPFTLREQHLLGVFPDHLPIRKQQKLQIGIQAAAQALWYKKGSSIPSIQAMKEEIWRDDKILSFLNLLDPKTGDPTYVSKRSIKNYIRLVYPIPSDKRKQKPSKRDKSYYSQVVPIPGIFLSNPYRINFLKLRLGVIALTKILSFFGLYLEEIQTDPILLAYKEPLRFYPKDYVTDWIEEGFARNGSIFDLSLHQKQRPTR